MQETFARPPAAFPAEEYAGRLEKFRKALCKAKLDGAVITRDVSRLYLTGFNSSAGTLLVDVCEGPVFIVDFRYIIMAERAMPFAKCILQKRGGTDALSKFTGKWRRAGCEALESRSGLERLETRLPKITEWAPVDGALAELRGVKSPREQKKLREAIAAGDALYSWALPQVKPGMTEWEARGFFRHGADLFGHGESFDTIVCAGANGAECHHEPDLTAIGANDPVLMDFGVVLDYYHSDMTRCIHFGKPTKTYREIYGIVLEANRRAIASVKPGMTGAEIDAVARDFIASHGYGNAFGHSLGHSVGMEIHEGPNFSPGEKRIIKPGMVVTVEPGIYLPGKLGIRIEDVVLVTRTGCEVLTKSARDL